MTSSDNENLGRVPYDSKTRQHISAPFFLGMLGSDNVCGVLMDSLQKVLDGHMADAKLLPTSLVVRGSTV